MPTLKEPLLVFCSVAPEDEPFCTQLHNHLRPLEQQHVLDIWCTRPRIAGTDWTAKTNIQLAKASIILLLISSSFVACDDCYGLEMQSALQQCEANGARIIPILLRPFDWKTTPFAHLAVLPDNGKSLTQWSNRDAAFANIAAGIGRVIGELTELSEQSPNAPQSQVWNVPHARNPHFTGRDELLERLDQQLLLTIQDDPTNMRRAALTQPQAIKGLGGIGKTQIAVEYAYRANAQGRYIHTLWINAASEETIITGFVTLADLLPSFSTRGETDQYKLVNAIKRWLEQCKQSWLLIFDNADDVSIIQEYLPKLGNGSVLLTTRADAVGSLATPIEVETMGFVEGTHLLLRRAQRFDHASDEEINEAGNIVVALDHFPLALDQAGAYIEETKCRFVDYLEIYQNHRKAVLARRGSQATNYPDSVATTWSLSFQKVEQANPAAAELLRLCAFLAPDRIPEELIKEGVVYWPPLLQQATTDLFAFNQMVEDLLKFSLVKRLVEDHALSIHRLVQAVQRDRMESGTQRQWAERAIRAINAVFPSDPHDLTAWPQCLWHLDQAQVCYALIKHYGFAFAEAASILDRTGIYLNDHALYTIAEPLYRSALSIREQQLGLEHPNTAQSLNNLAVLYDRQGKYEQAEPLAQRALSIREQQLGTEHPDTATSLHNLAWLYRAWGKYEQAEPLAQRALLIREQALGTEHPDTATTFHNLARL